MLEVTGAKDDRLNFHEFMGYPQARPEAAWGIETV